MHCFLEAATEIILHDVAHQEGAARDGFVGEERALFRRAGLRVDAHGGAHLQVGVDHLPEELVGDEDDAVFDHVPGIFLQHVTGQVQVVLIDFEQQPAQVELSLRGMDVRANGDFVAIRVCIPLRLDQP